MRRIVIMGPSGSGKSTLARQLGERLGLEVVHLDRLHWREGWVEAPHEEFREMLAPVLQRDCWVIEGNYHGTGTFEERVEKADAIVYLDLGRLRCMVRVLRRTIRTYGRTRPDLADGCPERFDWEFMQWVWSEPSRRELRLKRLEPWNGKVHVLRSPRQVRRFVERAQSGAEAGAGSRP